MLLGERLRQSKTFAHEDPRGTNYQSNGIQYVSLPGDVTIAYGWSSPDEWVLQVGHVQNGVRKVVSREFRVTNDSALDFDVHHWEEEVSR